MKRSSKIVALSLAAMILIAPISSFAATVGKEKAVKLSQVNKEVEAVQNEYIEFSGKVKSVNLKDGKGSILVEGQGQTILFHINSEVRVLDMKRSMENKINQLQKGAEVLVAYPVNTPMAMSNPPQVTPHAIVIKNGDYQVKVDRFDEGLVSSDNTLKLNIKGEDEAEDYRNKVLLVFYEASTRSIPAQTVPKYVLVLDIDSAEQFRTLPPRKISELNKVIIKGKEHNMKLFRDGDSTMVPVRDVAEALGYTVTWNNETKAVELEKGAQWTQLIVGENSYSFARITPFRLEKAPMIRYGSTYIPASFIAKILKHDISIVNGTLNVK